VITTATHLCHSRSGPQPRRRPYWTAGHRARRILYDWGLRLCFTFYDLSSALAAGLSDWRGLAGIAGLLIGIPTLKLKGDYLAIVTLGFGQIIQSALNNMNLFVEKVTRMVGESTVVTSSVLFAQPDGSAPEPSLEAGGEIVEVVLEKIVNGANGISNIPGFAPGVMGTPWAFLWSAITLMVIAIFLRNLVTSSHGRAMISIREDEIAAGTMGINVFNTKLVSFVISAVITGIAGGLYVVHLRTAVPNLFTFLTSVNFVIIIVLGGLGSNTGAIIGAFIFMLSQEWLLRDVIPLSNYKGLIFSFILIILMIFFPGGMMGKKELTYQLMNKWFKGLFPFDKDTQSGAEDRDLPAPHNQEEDQ
jgi:ABC-type branched-subunit amino acid transport system permease subunit